MMRQDVSQAIINTAHGRVGMFVIAALRKTAQDASDFTRAITHTIATVEMGRIVVG
jgi:hypothetical protein